MYVISDQAQPHVALDTAATLEGIADTLAARSEPDLGCTSARMVTATASMRRSSSSLMSESKLRARPPGKASRRGADSGRVGLGANPLAASSACGL